MLFSLAACGSSAAKSESYRPSSAPAAGYNSSYVYDDYAPEEPAAMAAEADSFGGFSASGSPANADAAAGKTPDAGDIAVDKIIYSANATIETTAFDDTVSKLEALIAQYGGFIESSSISGNNYYHSSHGYASSRSAEYRVRIPSRDFGTVMNSLSTLGNVPYCNTYTENITSQYYDVQARLNACLTQEQTLLEMMSKAEKVSDMLEIQDQLSDVRYRIESLQSTLTVAAVHADELGPPGQLQHDLPVRAGGAGVHARGQAELRRAALPGAEPRSQGHRRVLPRSAALAACVLVVFLVRRIRRRAKARKEKKLAAQAQAAPEQK